MKKYWLFFLTTLLSSTVFAAIESSFVTVSSDYANKQDVTEISNMPRVRNQDSLGICFGFSSQAVAQAWECKQKQLNCKNLSQKEEISPVDIVRWSDTDKSDQNPGNDFVHNNLTEGGSGVYALRNLSHLNYNTVGMESCYPFDQFANKYGDNRKAVDNILGRLKKEYEKGKTEAGACTDCILKIVTNEMGAKTDLEAIEGGLVQGTFETFLYTAIFDSCEDATKLTGYPKTIMYPENSDSKVSYSDLLNKAKEVLKTGVPFVLDGVCPYYRGNQCVGTHSVAVAGYRKVCKNDGSCRDLLKVHNSWGEDWQRKNNDGWVDAESLLTRKDKPKLGPQMGWLTKRK